MFWSVCKFLACIFFSLPVFGVAFYIAAICFVPQVFLVSALCGLLRVFQRESVILSGMYVLKCLLQVQFFFFWAGFYTVGVFYGSAAREWWEACCDYFIGCSQRLDHWVSTEHGRAPRSRIRSPGNTPPGSRAASPSPERNGFRREPSVQPEAGRARSVSATPTGNSTAWCAVCQANHRREDMVTCLPCNHTALCKHSVEMYENSNRPRCPCCRADVMWWMVAG